MKLNCPIFGRFAGAYGGPSHFSTRCVALRVLVMAAVMILAIRATALTLRSSPHDVTASLQPSTIQLGQTAQLAVTVQGDRVDTPDLPSVKGLQIGPVGESTSMQSVNGNMHNTITYLYQVRPTRQGTFTLPSIAVAGERTAPVVLKVLHKATGRSRGSPAPGNLRVPPPAFNTPNDQGAASAGEMAFLRVLIPKRRLHVGEMIPVTIKAYFRAGLNATLNGLPTLSSDAFTLNKLGDQPDETTEVVRGVPYTVLTWSSALAAVKAGDYSLGLDLPVLVRVRERSAHARNPFQGMLPQGMFNDPFFDDSFFDNFFGSVREKPMTLRTDPLKLGVLSLPTENRPDDFSGAVGQFTLRSEATPTHVAVGDPVTLKVEVTGAGNFDRVNLPGLQESDVWKTYRANSTFDPTDDAGYRGTKTFEQAIVPQKGGPQEVPAIHFSYFDPDLGRYVTQSTKSIHMVVTGVAVSPAVATIAPPSPTTSVRPTTSAPKATLAADKAEAGSSVRDLRPVFLSPWFIGVQGLIILAAAAGLVGLRFRERRRHDPALHRRRTARSAMETSLARMENAAQTGNASVFFVSARDALRERLASRWHIPSTAVTISEIDRRLNGDAGELHELFALADRAAYAGLPPGAEQLDQWKCIVTEQLKHVETL